MDRQKERGNGKEPDHESRIRLPEGTAAYIIRDVDGHSVTVRLLNGTNITAAKVAIDGEGILAFNDNESASWHPWEP